MLPAQNRLHREKDIKKTLKLGRSAYSPYFRLKYLKNDLGKMRLAIVISTKFSKKATIRNKLKRQIREIFRLNLDKINQNFDLVISASNQAKNLDFVALKEQIYLLMEKAKLLN